jgi:hypothetical protein
MGYGIPDEDGADGKFFGGSMGQTDRGAKS